MEDCEIGGLRDLIIQSNIIGKGSVEKVITGKHYNNGTRIFKYICDAFVRLQLDQFQDWLDDKNQHLVLPDFVESSEFQICLQGCRYDTFQKLFFFFFPF